MRLEVVGLPVKPTKIINRIECRMVLLRKKKSLFPKIIKMICMFLVLNF